MDTNGNVFGTKLVIALICLFCFGVIYNIIVERFQRRTQRFTAELVVGGVLVTVIVSGFFIGFNDMAVTLMLFIADGLPMIVGSWLRSARDDEQAKNSAREMLRR